MSSKKNIVVVGAGSAGILTAQGLSKALNPAEWSIQLVSNRQFHVHYVAMLRVLITDEGGLAPKALNPLDRVFESGKPGEVVYGEVVSVEDGAVNLDDGKTLSYDYLVIASGTTWEGPLIVPKTVEEKDKWIVDWREKFAKANDIVILGGGAVGTELAGELKHYYPSKHVTLVHAEEFLLNATYPPKFRKTVTANLKSYGVNVILDDKATIPAEPYTSVKTEKGQDVPADLVVPTWGGRRNTDYLQSFDSTILTPQGNVRVLPSLRVPLSNGKTNVYAAGDVIDWDEQKQLAKVPAHAEIVVANILASIQEKPAPKTYKGPAMEVMVLPAGPTKGASYFGILWGLTFGNWVTALIKSKTLFVWLAQQTTSTIFGSVRAFGFTWPAQVISKMSSGYGSPAPSARPVRSSTRKQKLPPGTPTPAAAPSTTAAVSTPQANNYFPQQYYGTPNQVGYAGTPGSYQQPTGAASAPVAALNLSGAGPTSAVPPIPTFHQARVSTYASRMRTGATLLMQPILSASGVGTNASLSAALTATGRSGRARAAVNYADAASGDEFEDDTEDEDFSQNKKEAAAKRAAKAAAGASGILGGPGAAASTELDQSYLGKKPPEKFISSRVAQPAKHQYYLRDAMEKAGERPELLVPIRVEVDTETHRIRDCFTWNLNEDLITPQAFATTFCNDLDLPLSHVDNIVTMIRAQLEEHSGVVTMDVGPGEDQAAEEPDCRVILRLDVQLDNYHLVDHIEWDLCSSPAIPETTPEAFAKQLCRDLGLRGESVSIISHALHEEILKHKKDAIEWGILGGGGGAVPEDGGYRRNQRGPRRLRGVWRDWMEFKDYGPRMEILTPEELEKKEMERERASRRMRRETSKFQRNTGGGSYRDNRPPRPSRLR